MLAMSMEHMNTTFALRPGLILTGAAAHLRPFDPGSSRPPGTLESRSGFRTIDWLEDTDDRLAFPTLISVPPETPLHYGT